MVWRRALPLAVLAAWGNAAVVERAPSPGFVSFPIVHSRSPPRPILSKRDNDVPLYNISEISYLIQLSIGTPGQNVKVAIDTGSDELWVNPVCSSSTLPQDQQQECRADGHYTASSSSTSEDLQDGNKIPYGKGTVVFEYFSDAISVPDSSISMKNVTFGVATASADLNEGILGLGWGNGVNLAYDNFVDALQAQGVTKTKAFTIALGSANADNGGVIIFGGVDTKKFSGSLTTLKILPPQNGENVARYWVQMDSIGLTQNGKSQTFSGSGSPIVLDSGSSLSYIPSDVLQEMASQLNGQYDSQNQLYIVDCSLEQQSGSSVDFTFSGTKISVPFEEFLWNVDGQHCVIGAQAVDPSSGVTALLGDSFLRSAYTVFDQTNNAIYIGQYANCGQNEQSIPAGSTGAGGFKGECSAGQGASGNSNGGSGSGSGNGKNAAARSTPAAFTIWTAVAGLVGVQVVMSFM